MSSPSSQSNRPTVMIPIALLAVVALSFAACSATVMAELESLPTSELKVIAGDACGRTGNEGDDGPAVKALFNNPRGIRATEDGRIFVADTKNNRIRVIDPDGIVHNFAGAVDGSSGNSGDGGQATEARLNEPFDVAVDASGNVYISDTGNNRVRKVGADGIIVNLVGNQDGSNEESVFGPTARPTPQIGLRVPQGIWIDQFGNLFVADTAQNRILRVQPDGLTTLIAGNHQGLPGNSGDDGPAVDATLRSPADVSSAPDGTVVIADTGNNRVRLVDPNGTITNQLGLSSGFGEFPESSSPRPPSALTSPRGVEFDGNGILYVADTFNSLVQRVESGAVKVVAGDMSGAFGPGTCPGNRNPGQLGSPFEVAILSDGNIAVADWGNNNIIEIVSDS